MSKLKQGIANYKDRIKIFCHFGRCSEKSMKEKELIHQPYHCYTVIEPSSAGVPKWLLSAEGLDLLHKVSIKAKRMKDKQLPCD